MSIKWVQSFLAFVPFLAVGVLLSTANADDRVAVVRGSSVVLTSGEITKLESALSRVFPALVQASRAYCKKVRNKVGCDVTESKSGTSDQYFNELDGGASARFISWNGSVVSYEVHHSDGKVKRREQRELDKFTNDAFPAINKDNIIDYECNWDGPTVTCIEHAVKTLGPDEAAQAQQDGDLVRYVGKVE